MHVSDQNNPQGCSTYFKLLHSMSPLSQALNSMGRAGLSSPLNAKAEQLHKTKLCFEAAYLDPRFLELCLRFYSLSSHWLARLACGLTPPANTIDDNDHAAAGTTTTLETLQLPLPMPPPMEFASLPEHFAGDICEFILLCQDPVYKSASDLLYGASSQVDSILSLLVVLLESPGYVRNPHLRMKFVAMIKGLLPPDEKERRHQQGLVEERPDFSNLFNLNSLAKRYLAPGLIRIYINAENTGGHNQAHDKVPLRENVYRILEHLCHPEGARARGMQEPRFPPDPCYRASLEECLRSHENSKKFISLLLNDTTKNFEDGVMHMGEAKVLQEEEDGGKWEGLNEEELKQKQDALKQAEGIARHFLGQTDKTIAFLAYVTERCAEPFLATVFVERKGCGDPPLHGRV